MDAENVYHRGRNSVLSMNATQDGSLLLRHEEIAGILNDGQLNDGDKLERLRVLVFPAELTPLEPVQLVFDLADVQSGKEVENV
jgi:hypothetical protein